MLIKKLLKTRPLVTAIACGFALHAQAQNDPEAANRLKEVQVVNTSPLPGIGIEKSKLPYEVQSVNSETLKAKGLSSTIEPES